MTEPETRREPGIQLRIYGVPAPQGSKSAYIRGGKPILAEGSSKVGRAKHSAWRQAVATAARDHLNDGGQTVPPKGPVSVGLRFLLPKPASKPKWMRWVTVKPDLDKLIRAVLDGLSDGGLIDHDQRVVHIEAVKGYAAPGEPAGCAVDIDTHFTIIGEVLARPKPLRDADTASSP